jgi:hypothetical protein
VNRFDRVESLERRSYFSPLVFSPAVSFPTGANPSDVITASLTNNGIQDLITSNFGSASISVLRGNGNGTFQPPVSYPVGNSPESIAVGDLQGNGIPDIVTANEADNTISVLLGNGDGTFQSQAIYAVGVRPESIAVADLTGNGLPDIVVADDGSASVDVLLNKGNGIFAPPIAYNAGLDPDGVAIGDFNGDGLPDLAVINPITDYVHVLLNDGGGTFAAPVTYNTGQDPRAIAVGDINSDGRPDIITTSLHSTQIDVLLGNGDGTFQAAQTYGTGFFPFSIAIADMNGDGRNDVVTANELDNTVGVLLHTGTGTFLDSAGYHGGQAPVAVAVADFNGDGKPDIVAADFNTNTVTVLTNETVFPNLIPTTITLSSNQTPVELGNLDVLTAQVTPSSLGSRRPIGVVQFFNGDAVLGVVRISADGIAQLGRRNLTLGDHIITVHYAGDGVYKSATSTQLLEQVVEPAQTVPLVEPTIPVVRLAREYVPGDRGIADVAITDIGDGPAIGVVGLQLFASTSSTFDSTAFPITIDSSTSASVHLAGGQTHVVPVTFTMPLDIEPVNYTIFAALSPVSGLSTAEVVSTPAVGMNSSVPVLEFGRVPTHANYKLTRTLSDGATITLSMNGPGTGTLVEDSSGGISVALTGTGGFGTFTLTGGPVTLDSLTDLTPIGTVNASTAVLTGSLSLNGSAGSLTLAGATNANLFIGGGAKASVLSLGTVTSSSLYDAGAIHLLAVNSWTNMPADTITTAWIDQITSVGDFGPALTVNGGTGPRDLGINSATIGGALTDTTWSIQTSVGTVQTAGIAAGWSGSIHGTLYSLIDTGDFAGNVAAHGIGSLQISGNLTDADILAGADFGAPARLSLTGNHFGIGTLGTITIDGSVTGSIVAAGLLPISDVLLAPGTALLRSSAIKSIIVSGTVDDASKFLSVSLPATARINGLQVATAGNLIFEL